MAIFSPPTERAGDKILLRQKNPTEEISSGLSANERKAGG